MKACHDLHTVNNNSVLNIPLDIFKDRKIIPHLSLLSAVALLNFMKTFKIVLLSGQ